MEHSFWHKKWEQGEIGFHERKPNPALVTYLDTLKLPKGARIFLPLCGKTTDIAWLVSQGYRVVGAELSPLAVQDLFATLELDPKIAIQGSLTLYSAPDIDIWLGDIFDLTAPMLGSVDAIYDRAALVALPIEMRKRYTSHLLALTEGSSQLLLTFEYDQNQLDGPPFSVTGQEVQQHYFDDYHIVQLAKEPIPGGIKPNVEATAFTWLLESNRRSPELD